MRLYETNTLEWLVRSRKVPISNRLKSKWNRRRKMNNTKVRVPPSLFDYWQEMAQDVNDLRNEKLRIAARTETNLEPFTGEMYISAPEVAGLLTPPWIETLLPDFYLLDDGEIEGIIHIVTSDLFGIASMAVTIRDEAGNLLERGDAMLDENWPGLWTYLPSLAPVVGTSVVVRAVAGDALGGMNIEEQKLELTDEYLRTSTTCWKGG
jgi:hypothetical protein